MENSISRRYWFRKGRVRVGLVIHHINAADLVGNDTIIGGEKN